MKIPTLLTGVALGAAAVPVAQITQEAIIKVSGNIDVRSPISVDAMPPLKFQTVPFETVQLDDTVGTYTVPAGKKLRITYFGQAPGNNIQHPTFVNVYFNPPVPGEFFANYDLRLAFDASGLIDPNTILGDDLNLETHPFTYDAGSIFDFKDWKFNGPGVDSSGVTPNGSAHRLVFRAELTDA